MSLIMMNGWGQVTNDATLDGTWFSNLSSPGTGVIASSEDPRRTGSPYYHANGTNKWNYEIHPTGGSTESNLIVGWAIKLDPNGYFLSTSDFHDFFLFEDRNVSTVFNERFNLRIEWSPKRGIFRARATDGGLSGYDTLGTTTERFNFYKGWYFVECKVNISGSGTAELRINGETVHTFSGDMTKGGTPNSTGVTNVSFGGLDQVFYTDMYLMDNAGSSENDFQGDMHIVNLKPDGEGNQNDFTPSTGSDNSALVDEDEPSGSDYVETTTDNHVDLYTLENLPAGRTPLFVQGNAYGVESDASGTASLAIRARSSTTESNGPDGAQALDTSSEYRHDYFALDPNGSAAWSESAVNALEMGVEASNIT